MAFCLYTPVSICGFSGHLQRKRFSNNSSSIQRFNVFSASKCKATTRISGEDNIERRSANYHPSIWDYDYFQSLKSDFLQVESYKERASKLQGEVKMMLDNVENPLEKLELIDNLQRLGLSHHFEEEINKVGNIKASLSVDCKGLLNLYEASYLVVEGETMLENAREFAAKHLKECLKRNEDRYLSMLAYHALELPLHWRMSRLEARWFIDVYEKNKDKNPIILELAILDYNMVQAMHQEDLRYASVWWKDLGLGEKLSFARDRLMENFLWSVGMVVTPRSRKSRIIQTKINALITVIDDVYDVYGTLDELELFTDAVERWDINATQRLPNYMKMCYHALHNSINEMAFDCLKEQGRDVIPFFKKLWAKLCKAFLLEAQWYHSGYTPTLQEYIDNAWISIAGSVMLGHAYLITDHITEEGLQNIQEFHPNIIRWSSMIVRLANDLATSSYELKRGDVAKSIGCYMHESGASEEEAREHVKKLIDATWKKMNEDVMAKSPFSRKFIEIAMNLARLSLLMYWTGDGLGIEDDETKDRVFLLFVHSIPVPK